MGCFRSSFIGCIMDIIFLLHFLVSKAGGDATCYIRYDVNSSSSDYTYSPCNNSAVNSPCCYDPFGDKCTPQGFCITEHTGIFIDGCTDPTWESSACSHLCPEFSGVPWLSNCPGGTYCCSPNGWNYTCCNTSSDQFYIDVAGNPIYKMSIVGTSIITALVQLSTSQTMITTTITAAETVSNSSQTSGSQTSPTSPPNPTPTTPGPSKGSAALSPGATAGLGVGTALAILLFAGLLWLYLRERNRRRAKEAVAPGGVRTHTSGWTPNINSPETVFASGQNVPRGTRGQEISELETEGSRRFYFRAN